MTMKKILFSGLIALMSLFTTNANAQVSFGVKGGLNVSSMKLNSELFSASNKTCCQSTFVIVQA